VAEKSLLWDTNGTGDGTGTGYTETDMIQLFRSLFTRSSNMGGVVPDYLNELAVTGTATPVAVNTGAGLVYGIPYWNTASVNVAISTPAVSTRVDRIVLRADWTAQTVRITRIAGTEGAGTPAMTQSAGTTWDVPLAAVSITTGGVITVTDAREWLLGTGDATIDSTKLATDAVTTAKITDLNVTAGKLASDSVTTAKILDGNVTSAKLADGAALAEILDDDGTGSGLDADLLDGSHASAFALTSHTHDPRTGLAGTNGVIADSANGSSRGTDAVDLQTDRAANAQVASGTNATVGGGKNNTASGNYATVPGGYGAVASMYGQAARGAGNFAAVGDAQENLFILRGTTTNGTQTQIYLDGSSAQMAIPATTTWTFQALISAYRTDSSGAAGYLVSGVIYRTVSGTSMLGSLSKTVLGEVDSSLDVTLGLDGLGGDVLCVFVTGAVGQTIRWVATVRVCQVSAS